MCSVWLLFERKSTEGLPRSWQDEKKQAQSYLGQSLSGCFTQGRERDLLAACSPEGRGKQMAPTKLLCQLWVFFVVPPPHGGLSDVTNAFPSPRGGLKSQRGHAQHSGLNHHALPFMSSGSIWLNKEGGGKKEEFLKPGLGDNVKHKLTVAKTTLHAQVHLLQYFAIFTGSLSLPLSISPHIIFLFPKPFDSLANISLLPTFSIVSFKDTPYVSTVKLSSVGTSTLVQNYFLIDHPYSTFANCPDHVL